MIDTQAIRNKILDLAIRGKLTEQLPEDGTAEELFQNILAEKQALINNGKIKKEKAFSESPVFKPYPFDIPKSWKFVRFGELMINRDSERIPVSVADRRKRKKIYDYYGASGVIDGIDDFLFEKDLLLIGEDGANLLARSSPIAFIASGKYWVNNHAHVLDVCSGTDIRYICRFINAISLEKFVTGSAQPKMNQENMNAIWVALPPYDEQKRIVDKIDQAFSVLDAIDTLQAQYADNLTTLKAKLIDAAIQGKLTEQLPEDGTAEELYQQIQAEKQALIKEGKIKKEKPLQEIAADEIPFDIPRNWKWVTLGSITSKITSGSTPTGGRKSNVYVESGFPLFREQNIYDDGIHQAGMVFITEDLLNTRQNSIVLAKDILLNITGGSIGRCALVPNSFDRGSINQHILIIRAVDSATRFYIHSLICSPYVQSYIKNKAVGDKDGFSGGRCKKILVPLPPLAEQKRIVTRLEEVLKAIEA